MEKAGGENTCRRPVGVHRSPAFFGKRKNPAEEIPGGVFMLHKKAGARRASLENGLNLSSEAVAAVYGAVAVGLEGNLAGLSALGANRVKHRT